MMSHLLSFWTPILDTVHTVQTVKSQTETVFFFSFSGRRNCNQQYLLFHLLKAMFVYTLQQFFFACNLLHIKFRYSEKAKKN